MRNYALVFRFLSRVVLVPFAHRAPAASIDTLDETIGEAHLALTQMIKVMIKVKII